jgi:hypothetical protein
MKKLKKRKYPAVDHTNHNEIGTVADGKWYTGWQGDIRAAGDGWDEDEAYHVLSSDHEVRKLRVRYCGYARGRSAAEIIVEDEQGFRYSMSMSGFDILMITANRPPRETRDKFEIFTERNLTGDGTWWVGNFIQTKQGQNYFIALAAIEQ